MTFSQLARVVNQFRYGLDSEPWLEEKEVDWQWPVWKPSPLTPSGDTKEGTNGYLRQPAN